MTVLPRVTPPAAGLAIIVFANAVALGGVAYNRMAPPDARLAISQREVRIPYHSLDTEDSGLGLTLDVRTECGDPEDSIRHRPDGCGVYPGARPVWLDRAKLRELGFDVAADPTTPEGTRRYERMGSRPVLLVLELDGPAYQRALARAQARHDSVAAAISAKKAGESGAATVMRVADSALVRELRDASRLFVIDAGLRATDLRVRYPDRARYAIVHGVIGIVAPEQGRRALGGALRSVTGDEINVPRHFRSAIEPYQRASWNDARKMPPMTLTIAFGRRLEPWLEGVSAAR